MSSLTGLRRADDQRLSLRLGLLCGPSTLTLGLATRHASKPLVRPLLDAVFASVGLTARGAARSRDLQVDGGAGPIGARLYEPEGVGADSGLLVYFHGGGWTVGGIGSHDASCRFVAREVDCKVLAVDYRMAPEHRSPAALDDATAAFRWAVAHAGELGVDPARVAVGGDSAGGHLAAAVCLEAGGGPRPCFAWLIYPVVDADIAAYPSAHLFARGPLLSLATMNDFTENYAPTIADRTDPRVTLIHRPDLDRMPPTFVATAGMDILRDQGEAFAAKLREAGVATESRRFANLPHGFTVLLIDPDATAALKACCAELATGLAPAGASAPTPAAAG